MNDRRCERSERVRRRADQGSLDEETRRHLAGCTECREVYRVARALRMAARAVPRAEVPSPAVLLWRARLEARQRDETRARRPLLLAQLAAVLFMGFSWLLVIGANWERWYGGILGWLARHEGSYPFALGAGLVGFPIRLAVLTVLCFLGIMVAGWFWQEGHTG